MKPSIDDELKIGYVSPGGRVAIEPMFDGGTPFSDHRAAVKYDGWWYIIDDRGDRVGSLRFSDVSHFHNGMMRAGIETGTGELRYGFIDHEGEWAVRPRYDEAYRFGEDYGRVRKGGRILFVDRAGEEIASYRDAKPMSEGLAPVLSDHEKRWGYVDANFDVVIPPRFEAADSFSEGLAAVALDGKIGYVDRAGRVAISPRFRLAYPFYRGHAPVLTDEGWVLIDQSGNAVKGPMPHSTMFDRVSVAEGDYFGATVGDVSAWTVMRSMPLVDPKRQTIDNMWQLSLLFAMYHDDHAEWPSPERWRREIAPYLGWTGEAPDGVIDPRNDGWGNRIDVQRESEHADAMFRFTSAGQDTTDGDGRHDDIVKLFRGSPVGMMEPR